jgi:hypothetical protein
MKVRNIAAHIPDGEEILIPVGDGHVSHVKGKGGTDVPEAVALSLLEQTDAWAPSGEAAKAAVEKGA